MDKTPKSNSMPSLFLSEKIAKAACLVIQNWPNEQLESNDLVQFLYNEISEDNARKCISTLRKMKIINASGIPTELGVAWANPDTRQDATKKIIALIFPEGFTSSDREFASSKEMADWLVKNNGISPSIASKNVTVYKLLLHLSKHAKSERPLSHEKRSASQSDSSGTFIEIPKELDKSDLLSFLELAKQTGMNVRLY